MVKSDLLIITISSLSLFTLMVDCRLARLRHDRFGEMATRTENQTGKFVAIKLPI